MDAKMKRKLVRVAAILVVALGAGQLLQSLSHKDQQPRVAHSDIAAKAKDVTTLAAGAEATAPQPQPQNPALTPPRLPEPSAALATATPEAPAPKLPALPAAPALAEVAKPAAPAAEPAKADPCAVTLDLSAGPNAMIGLSLVAACHPNERVVLKHAGLAVTGKTTATGALFADIPALEKDARVEVLFTDGAKAANSIAVPEMADLRRFAVQWQADDAFLIHAFEDELGYGGPGDVWAEALHLPAPGLPAKGGFLTLLGDPGTDLPMLAQVYTFPADRAARAEVVVEAPVTKGSCGREILGETLFSNNGLVSSSDLAAAMPDCDAIGDYLVLKNLVPDMNIAAN